MVNARKTDLLMQPFGNPERAPLPRNELELITDVSTANYLRKPVNAVIYEMQVRGRVGPQVLFNLRPKLRMCNDPHVMSVLGQLTGPIPAYARLGSAQWATRICR